MKLWKANEDDGDVDLTPMIDIVFLLIVFFMTVANMITAEKKPIEVPISLNSILPEEKGERTTVTVTRDGTLYSGVYEVTLDDLKKRLKEELEFDAGVRVFLRADSGTEHQFVNDVMQACASVGLSNIIFAAYQSEK
ncbi:MAG: biopolymer transporter ExbD [Verrucomicrobiota bacterium]